MLPHELKNHNYNKLKDIFVAKFKNVNLVKNLMYYLMYDHNVNSLYKYSDNDNITSFQDLIDLLEQRNVLNAENVLILRNITRILNDVQLTIYYERYEDFLHRYQHDSLCGRSDLLITEDALSRISEINQSHQFQQTPYPESNRLTTETIIIDDEEMELCSDQIDDQLLETDSHSLEFPYEGYLFSVEYLRNDSPFFSFSNDLTV